MCGGCWRCSGTKYWWFFSSFAHLFARGARGGARGGGLCPEPNIFAIAILENGIKPVSGRGFHGSRALLAAVRH